MAVALLLCRLPGAGVRASWCLDECTAPFLFYMGTGTGNSYDQHLWASVIACISSENQRGAFIGKGGNLAASLAAWRAVMCGALRRVFSFSCSVCLSWHGLVQRRLDLP